MRPSDDVLSPVLENFTSSDLSRLLGGEKKADLGQLVRRVIAEVKSAARAESWPLKRIEIDLYQDPEVAHWEYLVVLLVFDSSFDLANQYLSQLYRRLDEFSAGLKSGELTLFRRLIYFDVAAVRSP
ncbi:MAG TPA: hypothetical protein VI855_07925 [Dehalococcoidia bacterium]|nr:hypothetical protein [Dehalococcoidia bacterium]